MSISSTPVLLLWFAALLGDGDHTLLNEFAIDDISDPERAPFVIDDALRSANVDVDDSGAATGGVVFDFKTDKTSP